MDASMLLKVRWKNEILEVIVKPQSTLADLKDVIYTLTKIEPHRQSFPNFPATANVWDDNYTLQDLDLTPDFVLEMNDLLCEPLRSTISAEPTSSSSASVSSQIFPMPAPFHIGGGDQLEITAKEFKPLNTPRDGKKLVVLDVDHTIYDCAGPSLRLLARPYLQDFLAGVYLDYDIGIWSATNMSIVEKKMNVLGMTTSPHYKLLFLMDIYSMVSVPIGGEMVKVKPLDLIWSRYQQFNEENTVFCDDLVSNFYLNPRNGILIPYYSYKQHYKDRVLLKLLTYLKGIAKHDNLSTIDHSSWNQ